jgi:4a-hydroxytetrahydrobiopterin dehydratase
MTEPDALLSRTAASAAVAATGWRYLLGTLCASVPVDSLGQAAEVAAAAVAACGERADRHLRVDLRADRVELALQDGRVGGLTVRDTELAHEVVGALQRLGAAIAPPVTARYPRPVQMLEIGIDAMDIPAIRPFWKAVLGYADEPTHDGAADAIVDPAGQLPAVWFQQMDAPRPQRNRMHVDITVAHDEAHARLAAAVAVGGTVVRDADAPAYWVLADPEGNEACICTWQNRDERGV